MRVLEEAEVCGWLAAVWPTQIVEAVEAVYVGLSEGRCRAFPVVREIVTGSADVFGLKSGMFAERGLLGVKVSGYRAENRERGLDAHQSTLVLVDPKSGIVTASLGANRLTAMRTAAAGVIGLKYMARPDSKRAVIVGSGVQARAQAEAVWAWGGGEVAIEFWDPQDRGMGGLAEAAVAAVSEVGVLARPVSDPAASIGRADVVVTATGSQRPVVVDGWLRSGTHINAIGTDTVGKQELEVATLARSTIVVDDWAQARVIGECQHVTNLEEGSAGAPVSMGAVIRGVAGGRPDREAITIFDVTGLALQDLAVGALVARAALR